MRGGDAWKPTLYNRGSEPGPWPSSCLASSKSPRLQNNVLSPRGMGPALRASQSLPWHGHPRGWCSFVEDHGPHPNESPCCLVPPRAGHWLHLSGCFGMWETCSRGLCGPLESQLHQYVEQILWLSFPWSDFLRVFCYWPYPNVSLPEISFQKTLTASDSFYFLHWQPL